MTAVGALGAAALGGTARAALDAVVPAAFLALLWPRLRSDFPEAATQRRVALGGAVIALALTPFVPAGVQVIAAVVAVALAGRPRPPSGRRRPRRWHERDPLWAAVLAGSLGCYLLKLAGLSVPAAWVEQPWVARIVDFVPAALLAALVAVQAATTGQQLVIDGRLVGLAVAALAWRCGRRSSSSCAGGGGRRPGARPGFRTAARRGARGRAGSACGPGRRRSRPGCRRHPPPGGRGRRPAAGCVRTRCPRPGPGPVAEVAGQVAVGAGGAVRDGGDQLPHRQLKRVAGGAERQVERRPAAGEVLGQLVADVGEGGIVPRAEVLRCGRRAIQRPTRTPSSRTAVNGPIGEGMTACVRACPTLLRPHRRCPTPGDPDRQCGMAHSIGPERTAAVGRPDATAGLRQFRRRSSPAAHDRCALVVVTGRAHIERTSARTSVR